MPWTAGREVSGSQIMKVTVKAAHGTDGAVKNWPNAWACSFSFPFPV